jgi:hypothetical protein
MEGGKSKAGKYGKINLASGLTAQDMLSGEIN